MTLFARFSAGLRRSLFSRLYCERGVDVFRFLLCVAVREHTPRAKARVAVGLDVWAEDQTYLGATAVAGEATTEADSLREWKTRRARAKAKTNTGVSPLRRKSAPPVEMTEFGVRLGEYGPGAKARVVVGLDVWAEAQTYLGATAAAGEATTEADSLREWKTRRARATATTKGEYRGLSTAAAKCRSFGFAQDRDDGVWGEVGRATVKADSLREWKLVSPGMARDEGIVARGSLYPTHPQRTRMNGAPKMGLWVRHPPSPGCGGA